MELFDLPPAPTERLAPGLHQAVFGALPSRLAATLHTPEVGDLVLQLTDLGWRPGQIASRVGAAPAGSDPVQTVTALLADLREQTPPDAVWRAERAARKSRPAEPAPASDDSRKAWIAQIRAELSGPRTPRAQPVQRLRPPCALCEGESHYFVTREVRLCEGCVVLLGTGAVRLVDLRPGTHPDQRVHQHADAG
jgi:hypothetical protein